MTVNIMSAPTAEQVRMHRTGDGPRLPPLASGKVLEAAKLQFGKPLVIRDLDTGRLTARRPYDAGRSSIDVYRPSRWDTGQNLIYMDTFVQGGSPGDWSGSILYGQFTPGAVGDHLIALYFSGVDITMRLVGPWGTATAHAASVNDPALVLALWHADPGGTLFFEATCTAPNNLPGVGFVQGIDIAG